VPQWKSGRLTLSLACIALLASCAGIRERALVRGESAASPQASAAACTDAAAYSAESSGVAILVLRDGAIVCESYAEGAGRDVPHPLFSGTKGLNGLMAARAAGEGLLSIDEKVSDTLTEWRADPLKSQMTLRQLLSLSSGLATTGPRAAPGFAEAAATPSANPPGEVFRYGPIVFQTFGEVMSRKLKAAGRNETPSSYIEQSVLGPIGARIDAWGGPTAGPDPNLAAGARMTAADWAKVGELLRKPEDARRLGYDMVVFEAQGQPQGAYRGYGLTWWLATPLSPSVREGLDPVARTVDLPQGAQSGRVPADLVVAAGAGGQRLYVSRSEKLVVVRFAAPPQLAAQFQRAQSPEGRAEAAVRSGAFSDTEFFARVLAGVKSD
jgi:CubicO group peptidase (beta-lactamase class C family)